MAKRRSHYKSRRRHYSTGRAKRVLLLILLLAVIVGGFYILSWKYTFDLKLTHYEAFGIDIPMAYKIHGIDVSRYQKDIVWNEVKKMQIKNVKIGFAFIKATQGDQGIDPNFKYNWRNARKYEIPRGAYHYFLPGKNAELQARLFIKQVQLLPGDMPPVLDVEQRDDVPVTIMQDRVKMWLQMVEAHYGIRPIIYTNAVFYNTCLGKEFDAYPLWIAHYYESHKPRISRDWIFWQHNDGGNINGIDAKVDFNVFYGDSLQFKSILLQ